MTLSSDWRPSYFDLPPGELKRRAAEAHELLGPRCVVCPRGCKVDRREDVKGRCAIGRHAVVASYFPHFGEEDCLRGRRGSGTIFFSGCNLRCVFCQNHDISWEVRGDVYMPDFKVWTSERARRYLERPDYAGRRARDDPRDAPAGRRPSSWTSAGWHGRE